MEHIDSSRFKWVGESAHDREAIGRPSLTFWQDAMRRLVKNRVAFFCLVVILLCSIILIVESLVFKKEKIVEFDWTKEKPAILLILALCLYVFLIIKLGFILASAIIFSAVLFYCGERKPFIYIFTIALAVGIYFLFSRVFHVSLPAGILPF